MFAMERPSSSRAISALIVDAMNELVLHTGSNSSDLVKYKTLMYLISDILFNSVQTTEAWSYVRHFEQAMPLLMQQTQYKLRHSTYGKLSIDRLQKDLKQLFRLWASKSIFDERLTTGWLSTLHGQDILAQPNEQIDQTMAQRKETL